MGQKGKKERQKHSLAPLRPPRRRRPTRNLALSTKQASHDRLLLLRFLALPALLAQRHVQLKHRLPRRHLTPRYRHRRSRSRRTCCRRPRARRRCGACRRPGYACRGGGGRGGRGRGRARWELRERIVHNRRGRRSTHGARILAWPTSGSLLLLLLLPLWARAFRRRRSGGRFALDSVRGRRQSLWFCFRLGRDGIWGRGTQRAHGRRRLALPLRHTRRCRCARRGRRRRRGSLRRGR